VLAIKPPVWYAETMQEAQKPENKKDPLWQHMRRMCRSFMCDFALIGNPSQAAFGSVAVAYCELAEHWTTEVLPIELNAEALAELATMEKVLHRSNQRGGELYSFRYWCSSRDTLSLPLLVLRSLTDSFQNARASCTQLRVNHCASTRPLRVLCFRCLRSGTLVCGSSGSEE
jgi:hypothetical protein